MHRGLEVSENDDEVDSETTGVGRLRRPTGVRDPARLVSFFDGSAPSRADSSALLDSSTLDSRSRTQV